MREKKKVFVARLGSHRKHNTSRCDSNIRLKIIKEEKIIFNYICEHVIFNVYILFYLTFMHNF